jgi:hypothetical protein
MGLLYAAWRTSMYAMLARGLPWPLTVEDCVNGAKLVLLRQAINEGRNVLSTGLPGHLH